MRLAQHLPAETATPARFATEPNTSCLNRRIPAMLLPSCESSTALATVVVAKRGNHPHAYHHFHTSHIAELNAKLMEWYIRNQRAMPWRIPATESGTGLGATSACISELHQESRPGQRAYEVWVSEIMCQQTQVKTVIGYYDRWMRLWPTVVDLAASDIEDVNKCWSGLGYYSRAKRLHEAAKLLVAKYDGVLPREPERLEKEIPGIGAYTAGAIASIAYNVPAAVVDGNVMRVLSRLRAIGSDPKSKSTQELIWDIARSILDRKRPGDHNQALMELGATVCTPTTPSCSECPVSSFCHAYSENQVRLKANSSQLFSSRHVKRAANDDFSDECDETCSICDIEAIYADTDYSVVRFPRKAVKKPPRTESAAVCVVSRRSASETVGLEYLVLRRPETGLLAGLWEFPAIELGLTEEVPDMADYVKKLAAHLTSLQLDIGEIQFVAPISHIFSHIRKTYYVYMLVLPTNSANDVDSDGRPLQWIRDADIASAALSTAMRKVFKAATEGSKSSSTAGAAPRNRGGKEKTIDCTPPIVKNPHNFFKKRKASSE